MTNLSKTAKRALAGTVGYNIGTVVPVKIGSEADRELQAAGLTGPRGGLTMKGSIQAQKLQSAALDDVFGPL